MLKRNQLSVDPLLHPASFQPRRSAYRIVTGSLRVIGEGDDPEPFQVDRFRCSFQIPVKSFRSGIVIARNKDDGKTDVSEKMIQFSEQCRRFRIAADRSDSHRRSGRDPDCASRKIECFAKQLQSQFAAPGRYLHIGGARIMQIRNDRTV